MMKPIDLLGFGPSRRAHVDGEYIVITVKPPVILELPERCVKLTHDQFERYISWANGGRLLQEALHDLTIREREILLTGIDPQERPELFNDQEP